MFQVDEGWGRTRIFFKSRKKAATLIILSLISGLFSGAALNPVVKVHALGSFDYTLSNAGGVSLTPGNSGSTTIIETLTGGTASNVTLACDLTNISNLTIRMGTSCSFAPASVTPTFDGNYTVLTMTVPASATYGSFSISVTAKSGTPAPLAPTTLTLTVAAKVAVNPTAKASLSYTKGTLVTVELNTTGSPDFGGYIVAIFFNSSVLQFSRVDYSGNGFVFGNDIFVSGACLSLGDVPGVPIGCIPDLSFDGPDVLSLFLTTDSGNNYHAPNGVLADITFTVADVGFSPIHIVFQQVQTEPNGVPLNTVGYDGYFTNKDCGGSLCKPPIVSFRPPLRPIVLRPASFRATSGSQNPNGVITEYNWTWGLGRAKGYYNSPIPGKTQLVSNVTITFLQFGGQSGGYIVTVSAQDNFGTRAYYSQTILVFRVWVDLGLSGLSTEPAIQILPGTVVHIVATAFNNGVNPENSTFRLSINNQNVSTQSVVNLGPDGVATVSYNWNTAGLTPRVYRVDVSIDEIRDPITSRILENDTVILQGRLVDPNNARVAFVQLVTALPSGFGLFLGLNLPETLGLGIVLLAIAGFVFGLVKKARAPPPEPL